MDQIKIGKFIANCRKDVGLTQAMLAEKLGITDRAVSKWETGKAMPDSSVMLDLCKILGVTVNDLLSGEVVSMNDYNEELEKKLIELVKEKEEADKKLLAVEVVIGVLSIVFLLTMVAVASYVPLLVWQRVLIIVAGFMLFIVGCTYALKIEQVAGYYKCGHCGHKYVPTFSATLGAMHMGRTRFIKCPKCGKSSWQKKVISKE